MNLEGMKDEIIGSGLRGSSTLQVTPSMKKNVCAFIEKAVSKTYIDVLQRISAEYL